MKLESLHIKHFRVCKDVTINFDNYTCLVGPNGAGKSSVLQALNILFRNTAGTSTNLINLSEEDFFNKETEKPIEITATFSDLPDKAKEDLKAYVRQEKLIITAKAQWSPDSLSANVKQYGQRLIMKDFAPYFIADKQGEKAAALKALYGELRKEHTELPNVTSKGDMESALREYEEAHSNLCELQPSEDQFYGFTAGGGHLEKFIQWIYIPAVKDASEEQDEAKNTALGELLQRTVRTKVKFDDALKDLRELASSKYKDIVDKQQGALDDISKSLQNKLQEWAHPGAQVKIKWNVDLSKSVKISEPMAKADIGEGGFIGEIARMGHGMQRAFIVTVLQELATINQESEPILLLGFEEPELYQHPPQARHLAKLLEDMANAQVIVTTHSPYFVSGKGFQNIRMMRKQNASGDSIVAQATMTNLSERLASALGKTPAHPTSLMAIIEQIMQPSIRELYFCNIPVLVEGIEDVAFISTYMELTNKLTDFRRVGGHFVVCSGKTNMSRPLAIAIELGIPFFAVFDADTNSTTDKDKHERDNKCLLNLCSLSGTDALPVCDVWEENVVMWCINIGDTIRNEIGSSDWDDAQQEIVNRYDFQGVRNKQKNSILISATLEHLFNNSKKSKSLEQLCDKIISYGESLM